MNSSIFFPHLPSSRQPGRLTVLCARGVVFVARITPLLVAGVGLVGGFLLAGFAVDRLLLPAPPLVGEGRVRVLHSGEDLTLLTLIVDGERLATTRVPR